MSHPSFCTDPNCTLSYGAHITIHLANAAIPSRGVNTEGMYDANGKKVADSEPLSQTLIRERRIERDTAAYRRLHAEGLRPRRVEGSAHRERHGETKYDIEQRPVTIDYSDPR